MQPVLETPWYPLELSKPYNDEFKINIPPEWLKQEGTIILRMKGIAGSSDFTLPIRKPSGTVQPTVHFDKAKPALEKKFCADRPTEDGDEFLKRYPRSAAEPPGIENVSGLVRKDFGH